MKIHRRQVEAGAFTQVQSNILKDFSDAPQAGFRLIQILSHKDGYLKSIADIKKKIGITEREWKTIKNIFEVKGYMCNIKENLHGNKKTGKFTWDIQFSDSPVKEWIKDTIPQQAKDSLFTKEEWVAIHTEAA